MASQSFLDAFDQLGDALGGGGESVLTLPLDLVDEDPNNPRRTFDQGELEALAATMKTKGLLQPITVRPPGPDGRYTLRFGARRLRAARLAGLHEIRALVQPGELDEADAITEQLIENDQRAGLNTAELADAVHRLMAIKLTQAEVGRRLGRPKDQIAMLAAVPKMAVELQALAPELGLRTLYELNSAWKISPERTRLWLVGREPSEITQAAARELAGRPAPSRQASIPPPAAVADAPTPAAPLSRGERERRRPGAGARGVVSASTPVIEVTVKGKRGRLVLDDVTEAVREVRVALDDGGVLRTPLSQVKLVGIRPG